MLINSYTLVSVVIPTYGRADLLNRAIDSVLKQTYENIEIIVVNDNNLNSEHYEATMISLQKYETNPKVKVISDGSNVGGSLARNKGIELSQGEYISFLDDDDYFYENKIEKQIIDIRKENSDVSVCGMNHEENGAVSVRQDGNAIVGDIANFLLYGRVFTPMILVKKSVAEKIGKFTDAPQFQDHIFMIKLIANDFKVSVLKDRLFVHTVHNGQRITSENIKLSNYTIRRNIECLYLDKLTNSQKRKYFLKFYLTNSRYYRDKKDFKEFGKNLIASLKYTRPLDFPEILKVFVSYYFK